MLGEQRASRYLRDRGGSAADEGRDRQRKLDGVRKWKIYPAIESLLVMLQSGLLSLGLRHALSLYLWAISHTVAGIIIALTLFGVISYVFLILAATLYYDCPYQAPPIIVRTATRYLKRSDAAVARLLRTLVVSLPSVRDGRISCIRSGVRGVLGRFGCTPTFAGKAGHIPLAIIMESPTRIFEDISIGLEVCRVDSHCISWVLESTTDPDVIFSTTRLTAGA